MTIISSLKTYLATYASLASGRPIWVDYIGVGLSDYSILPLPGTKILEEYLDGKSQRVFPFAFQSVESTADELERLETVGFYEAFSDWLDSQTAAGSLPTLAAGKTAEEIEATGWAFLYQEGQSHTGIYQVQCRLVYGQD